MVGWSGRLKTNSVFKNGKYNTAFLLGEGLFRWRLNDTYLNDNNLLFDSFITKIVQYLFSDDSKAKFHINYDPVQSSINSFFFEAELYNANFELVNQHDVNMKIIDSLGNEFSYQFNKLDDKYYLDVNLIAGKYDFIANVQMGEENFTKRGSFLISNFSIEKRDLIAKHNLLSDLSLNHGGYASSVDSLEYLLDYIINSSTFQTKSYVNYDYQSLINFKSLLFLIIFCLFIEWFLRRRYINY